MKNFTNTESDIIFEGPNDTLTLRVNTDGRWKVKMTSKTGKQAEPNDVRYAHCHGFSCKLCKL